MLRRFFEMVPILAVPIALYALFALMLSGGDGVETFAQGIEKPLTFITLPSGAPWAVSGGDLLVLMGLVILFFELTRGVGVSPYAIVHHTLAVLLALGCLGAFIAIDAFSTSSFFLLTVMCWLDMVGGVIFNIASATAGGGAGRGKGRGHSAYDDYEN
ncbi:MAG: hypothetical protein HC777_01280 [Hyphomonadaceae bacterium]|nr:hypothetical protein [Hyphomonadaceae bacterium]